MAINEENVNKSYIIIIIIKFLNGSQRKEKLKIQLGLNINYVTTIKN